MLYRFIQEIKSWPLAHRLLALLGLLLITFERLWFLNSRNVHIDEAYTFIEFTYQGIWRSMSYYPVPNNHIFITILTAICYAIFEDAFWSLRLPALLISFFGTIYIFCQVCKRTSFWVAILSTGLFCLSFNGLFYSFHARGYFLITVLSVMAAFSVMDFVQTKQRKHLIWLVISSVTGFYTVPVFLYAFLSVLFFGSVILILNRNWKAFSELVIAAFITGLLTIIFYIPVFIESGVNAVIGNEFVVPVKFSAFLKHYKPWFFTVEDTLIGREPGGKWVAFLIIGGLLILLLNNLKQKGKTAFSENMPQFSFLLLSMILLPFGFLFLQMVLPPTRVFTYLAIFQFIGLAFLLQYLTEKFKIQRLFPVVSLVLLVVYGSHQARALYKNPPNQLYIYDELIVVLKKIEAEKPDRIYVQDGNLIFFTQNATATRHKPIRIDHKKFNPNAGYKYIMLEVKKPKVAASLLKDYKEFYNNGHLIIYKRN